MAYRIAGKNRWHPMDMCYCVSILKTQDEFLRDVAEGESGNAAHSLTSSATIKNASTAY